MKMTKEQIAENMTTLALEIEDLENRKKQEMKKSDIPDEKETAETEENNELAIDELVNAPEISN